MVDRQESINAALVEMTAILTENYEQEDLLRRVCRIAVDAIPPVDFAGILDVASDGSLETLAYTDPLVQKLEDIQRETREGPCLEAIEEHGTFLVEDTATDEQWPAFSRRAHALGVTSAVATMLRLDGRSAALNLFVTSDEKLTADHMNAAALMASQTGVVLASASALRDARMTVEQLREALQSRDVTARAVGILMEREKASSEEAFEMLKRASQHLNVKLRKIAEDLVREHDERSRERGSPQPRSD